MDYLPNKIEEVFKGCEFSNAYGTNYTSLRIKLNDWNAWLELDSDDETNLIFHNFNKQGGYHLHFKNVDIDDKNQLEIIKETILKHIDIVESMMKLGSDFDLLEIKNEIREKNIEKILL